MRSNFNDFLHFNPKEKRGIIFLIVLIVALLILKQNIQLFYSEPDRSKDKLDSLRAKFELDSIKLGIEENELIQHKAPPFSFDPNKLSKEEWLELGLSDKQAQILLNYLNKGGRFKKKSDLKKVYSISDSFYAFLEDSIILPKYDEEGKFNEPTKAALAVNEKPFKERKKYEYIPNRIFLNNSDTLDWQSLYGIGPVYAKRIVKYRESLGGFYSVNQLYEVWGIQDSVIDKFFDNIKIDTLKERKLNINKLDASEFKMHPYINWNVANAIVNYRNSHGKYKDVIDLKKIHIVNDSLFKKIEPYLTR